ncbi:hypothetical protein TNCV_1163871, partial [Trichonephila clavipes]
AEFESPASRFARLKAFQTTDTAVRKFGGGRPKTITAGDDRYIILKEKRDRQQSESTLLSNGTTGFAVYCGQTPSQRGPIRPPS